MQKYTIFVAYAIITPPFFYYFNHIIYRKKHFWQIGTFTHRATPRRDSPFPLKEGESEYGKLSLAAHSSRVRTPTPPGRVKGYLC